MPFYATDNLDHSQDAAEALDATYAVWDALDELSDDALEAELLDEQSADWFDHLADLPIDPKIHRR